MKAIIVGGSLVGPLTELLLRSIGIDEVTTYEAAPAARPQAGGIIGVRETGFEALAQAQVPLSEVVAYPGKEVITYNIADRQVIGLRDSSIYPGETTAWDIFHDAVARRTDIQYGKKAAELTDTGVRFTDGTEAEADLVIWCDGRNSTGRALLDPDRALAYQNYVVWRGLTAPVDEVVGFTRYRNDQHGNLLSLTEPIQQGTHLGRTDWTYYQNLSEAQFTALVGRSPTDRVFLLPKHITPAITRHVADYAQQYLPPDLVSVVTDTADLMAVPINDLDSPTRAVWRHGQARHVLVGDALMTVRPHSGRGVNNGIDQAWSLVGMLAQRDLDQALLDHQAQILPQLDQWVQLGRLRAQRNGLGVHVDGTPRN